MRHTPKVRCQITADIRASFARRDVPVQPVSPSAPGLRAPSGCLRRAPSTAVIPQIAKRPLHCLRIPYRDFVPWHFSDASRRRMRMGLPHRRPSICT